jgi:hypothetical protein
MSDEITATKADAQDTITATYDRDRFVTARIVPDTVTLWYIAHNGVDGRKPSIMHHGSISPGGNVRTGQPVQEAFTDSTAWARRVVELGGVLREEDAEMEADDGSETVTD